MVQDKDKAVFLYKNTMYKMTKYMFPDLCYEDMDKAMNWSIKNRQTTTPVQLKNNYTGKEVNLTLRDMTNYIYTKEPICTAWGVLFKHHGEVPNPLTHMIQQFMDQRGIHKSEMFKYPKGSEMFSKFNMLQLLDKIDCNAIYGAEGAPTSIFYNINIAASITATGRSLISSVTMFFEMFLSNNVKFASLDDIITFIDNVTGERDKRHYYDNDILDKNVTREECFAKLIYTCGDFRRGALKWIPDEKDLDIIWNILNRLPQDDINRIYYKNNLFEFIDNTSMTKAVIYILNSLQTPYMDPNEIPEEVTVEMETLVDLLREYVFYDYQIIDRIDRCDNMIKNVSAISDTDSAIVCIDGWYRYILNKVQGLKFPITQITTDEVGYLEGDKNCTEKEPTVLDYDFYNDEIIEIKKSIKPTKIIPQNGLRYSIINILAHACGVLVNEYMVSYTKQNHSYQDDRKCLIISKNEYLMKRALLTNAKKNYAVKLELQEGNIVPDTQKASLEIKGLPINKSTLNESARKELQRILYEDILNSDEIDQLQIVKHLRIFERQIYKSLESGEKKYYKPLAIKSISKYDNPMSIQGIKASYIWNIIRDNNLEPIDLESRNTIDIVKVDINERNVDKIKDSHPDTYEKIISVLRDSKIQKDSTNGSITSLAIPTDVQVPDWVMEFIDYTTIINDCLCNFPIESIGINKSGKQSINYTNIISL